MSAHLTDEPFGIYITRGRVFNNCLENLIYSIDEANDECYDVVNRYHQVHRPSRSYTVRQSATVGSLEEAFVRRVLRFV